MNYNNSKLLLLDEHPLQVLPELAKLVGLNEALFLQQLHYWITTYRDHHVTTGKYDDHYRDNNFWVYNTVKEWQANFPWWNVKTVQRIIKGLEDKGILITGNYNKYGFDKTKWYRIDMDKLYFNLGKAKAEKELKEEAKVKKVKERPIMEIEAQPVYL